MLTRTAQQDASRVPVPRLRREQMFCLLELPYTGRIEIRFTTCTQRFFLEPSIQTRYAYYSYPTPDPFSWQYFSTVVNNTTKIATVLGLYGFRSF
jgi:hypothetical protein